MAEEFLGGFHAGMQSETGSSGLFFNGDLKSRRWPTEVPMGKRAWPWEDSLDSKNFHGSDHAETSDFLIDPVVPASHLPLSSSSDWTQLLM